VRGGATWVVCALAREPAIGGGFGAEVREAMSAVWTLVEEGPARVMDIFHLRPRSAQP